MIELQRIDLSSEAEDALRSLEYRLTRSGIADADRG